MNKVFFLLVILFIGCKEKRNELPELNSESIEVKLPEYEDWKESYSHPMVKEVFEEHKGKTEVLGVYLNNDTDKIKDSLINYNFEDYAVVLNIEKEQKWKIEKKHLDRVSELQKKYVINTKKPREKVEELSQSPVNEIFEKPILLEDYWINDDIYALVTLVQPFSDEPETIVIMIMNTVNVQNHLTYLAYFLDLDGYSSIELAKKNNHKMAVKFEQQNRK